MKVLEWIGLHPLLSVVLLAVLLSWIAIIVVGFESISGVWHAAVVASHKK